LENLTDFKYLDSIKASDGTCTKDIKCRIGMAKQKMVQLNNIWKNKGVPRELKIRTLKCLIWPVVLYGSEAWALRKDDENRIQAAEMWFYRRLLRVKWTDKRTNESVLKELGVQRLMLSEISKKRLKYLGHANRNTKADLMTTVLQGKVEAKRNQGRPPTSYIDNVKADSGLQLYEVIHHSRDRDRWRPVVEKSGAPMDGHGHGDR
jgi:hypothetical protein